MVNLTNFFFHFEQIFYLTEQSDWTSFCCAKQDLVQPTKKFASTEFPCFISQKFVQLRSKTSICVCQYPSKDLLKSSIFFSQCTFTILMRSVI